MVDNITFESKSMSEDNLYTRRKNLAVHLGVDETVSMKEVQKINTYCLPVQSSALPPEAQEAIASTARYTMPCQFFDLTLI